MKYLKRFDFFGYIPAFRIDGSKGLQSVMGGVLTVSFILFALGYSSYSIYSYIININSIATSRIVISNSQNYTFQSLDAYYGIGFTDLNQNYINLTKLDYLQFSLEYIVYNVTTKISSVQVIPFEKCSRDIFIPDIEFKLLSKNEQNVILYQLNYFICPKRNFTFILYPYAFSTDQYSLAIKVNLKNNTNVNYIQDSLTELKPTLNFLYQKYTITSDSKLNPYYQSIGIMKNELGLFFSKIIDLTLNPFDILDDLNPIVSGNYISLDQKEFTTQPNATIFQTSRFADYFRYYPNRNPTISSNTANFEDLNLININVSLESLRTTTYRTYRKFNDFVASVSSIISNMLVMIAVIATYMNSIKGTNNMITSIFNKEKLNKLDFLNFLFKSVSRLKVVNRKTRSKIERETHKFISKLESKNAQLLADAIFEDNMKKSKVTQIQLLENKDLSEKIKTKVEKKIEDMMNDRFTFSLKEFFKYKFCSSKKSHVLLENAITNVEYLLDINTYLKFRLEMDFIMQIFLDDNQKYTFDVISHLLNFNTLFEPREKIIHSDEEFKRKFVSSFQFLCTRNNDFDKKIITFAKQILV